MRKLVRLQHRDAFEGSSSSGSSGSIESDRLNFVFIKISSTETLPQSLDPLARGRRRARLHQPRRNHSDSLARQKKGIHHLRHDRNQGPAMLFESHEA